MAMSSPSWVVPLFSGGAPLRGDWRTSGDSQGMCCVSLTASQDMPALFTGGQTEATRSQCLASGCTADKVGPQEPGSPSAPCVGGGQRARALRRTLETLPTIQCPEPKVQGEPSLRPAAATRPREADHESPARAGQEPTPRRAAHEARLRGRDLRGFVSGMVFWVHKPGHHPGNHSPRTSRGSDHNAEGWATVAEPLGGQGQSWSEQAGPSCGPSSCRE